MKHLELFVALLFKQCMFILMGLSCVAMLSSACFGGSPDVSETYVHRCRHDDASECTRFCAQNHMEVASWDGNHPSSHCPNCGCSCKPRITNP